MGDDESLWEGAGVWGAGEVWGRGESGAAYGVF